MLRILRSPARRNKREMKRIAAWFGVCSRFSGRNIARNAAQSTIRWIFNRSAVSAKSATKDLIAKISKSFSTSTQTGCDWGTAKIVAQFVIVNGRVDWRSRLVDPSIPLVMGMAPTPECLAVGVRYSSPSRELPRQPTPACDKAMASREPSRRSIRLSNFRTKPYPIPGRLR